MVVLIRAASIKLAADPKDFLPTIEAYTKAFNYVCQVGFEKKQLNGIELHKLTYHTVREYLPSQLACSSRVKATEALKSVLVVPKKKKGKKRAKKPETPTCPVSIQQSIRYDARSYTLRPDRNEVSLLTIDGRKKFSLNLSEYHQEEFSDLDGWEHTSAELFIRKGKVYLNIVFQKEIPDVQLTGNVIGMDRGISKVAVTSNNTFFGGKKVRNQVRKYQGLRSRLQASGTKSAKRHLARLSGTEKRFRADTNHKISKQIVSSLNPGDVLVLEDLTGIRDIQGSKRHRMMINKWSFFQLEQFIVYKAMAKGIAIAFVPAAYTSQMCSECGFVHQDNRKTQASFACLACGFKLNADLNASRNIRDKHLTAISSQMRADVNPPIVTEVELQASGFSRK